MYPRTKVEWNNHFNEVIPDLEGQSSKLSLLVWHYIDHSRVSQPLSWITYLTLHYGQREMQLQKYMCIRYCDSDIVVMFKTGNFCTRVQIVNGHMGSPAVFPLLYLKKVPNPVCEWLVVHQQSKMPTVTNSGLHKSTVVVMDGCSQGFLSKFGFPQTPPRHGG